MNAPANSLVSQSRLYHPSCLPSTHLLLSAFVHKTARTMKNKSDNPIPSYTSSSPPPVYPSSSSIHNTPRSIELLSYSSFPGFFVYRVARLLDRFLDNDDVIYFLFFNLRAFVFFLYYYFIRHSDPLSNNRIILIITQRVKPTDRSPSKLQTHTVYRDYPSVYRPPPHVSGSINYFIYTFFIIWKV